MIVRTSIKGDKILPGIVQAFLVAITVLVVAIPEGLPLAVTLSLAFSVKKMLKEKNLVRKLHACETMGGANIICSDKTGTLTMNEMYLTHFWNLEPRQIYNTITSEVQHLSQFVGEPQINLFKQATCCNSSADPDAKSGNPTEMAIVKYIKSCGLSVSEVRKQFPVVADEPFSSDRKRMSTLIRDSDGRNVMMIKGASELILECCDKLIDLKTGSIKLMGEAEKEEIKAAITLFAQESLRTIGIAYSYPDKYDKESKDKDGVLECESKGLTLIGVLGIKDIIRPEVPEAVKQCRTAGVQVKMVTGDN
jgi:P-type Ca2+ transporter type 2B